jgi:hypothetical protein
MDAVESAASELEHHWLMVRGTCTVCSYTVSSDFRTIDEKNRDDINKFFNLSIDSGTICMTCYNEYLRWRREGSSFPFGSFKHQLEDQDEEVTLSEGTTLKRKTTTHTHQQLESENNTTTTTGRKKKARTSSNTSNASTTAAHTKQEEDLSLSIDEKMLNLPSPSADLSYLSNLKVSELQDQLRKYNASTKGSKAQLIQRLVRYICLFNNTTPPTNDLSYLSGMRVSELQDQLRKYNASTKGTKAELVQRLVRYICLFNNEAYKNPNMHGNISIHGGGTNLGDMVDLNGDVDNGLSGNGAITDYSNLPADISNFTNINNIINQ